MPKLPQGARVPTMSESRDAIIKQLREQDANIDESLLVKAFDAGHAAGLEAAPPSPAQHSATMMAARVLSRPVMEDSDSERCMVTLQFQSKRNPEDPRAVSSPPVFMFVPKDQWKRFGPDSVFAVQLITPAELKQVSQSDTAFN